MARAGWSKSRLAGLFWLGAQRQAPAMDFFRMLIDIAEHPGKYPKHMERYLEYIMPKLEEGAVAGGMYNREAVMRKAFENMYPYFMNLGVRGAAGLAGTPLPPLGTPGKEAIEIWGPMLGAAGGAASNMAGSYFGMGGGGGGGSGYTRGMGTGYSGAWGDVGPPWYGDWW